MSPSKLGFDQVIQTIKGQVCDEPIISLWQHFPQVDLNVDQLIMSTIRFQEKMPSDLIKLSPHGKFPMVDFGCKIEQGKWDIGATGATRCIKCVVDGPNDWSLIEHVDPLDGHYGEQLMFIKEVKRKFPDIPIMMTIFMPSMIGRKLSNNNLPLHLSNPEFDKLVKESMNIVSQITEEFCAASIDTGADGLFLAVQEADKDLISNNETRHRVLDLNLDFWRNIQREDIFTVLHVHGEDVQITEALTRFPSSALNWHDFEGPSIEEASKLFSGGLLGGINQNALIKGDYDINTTHLNKLRKSFPFILSPGCVLLQGTELENLTDKIAQYRRKIL